MLFSQVLFGFLSLSFALSHPLKEDDGIILARSPAKSPAKSHVNSPVQSPARGPPAPLVFYNGNSIEAQAHKANNAHGRTVPKACKHFSDCKCPKSTDPNIFSSTSCIGGFCSCNSPIISFMDKEFIKASASIANSPVMKAIVNLMQGLEDVEEVVGLIAGTVLGPEARLAIKAALKAIPDFGPSHIDQATKGILNSVLR